MTDKYLLEIFRSLAGTHQRVDPRVFYPLRQAAKQLRAPISAVARIYEQLKEEGVLSGVRSSRTVLEGSGVARGFLMKSFIGLPVSYSCFMTLHDYRTFCFEVGRESKRCGILSNPIFFEDTPQGLRELGETLEEVGFDAVIWFLPRTVFRGQVLRLKDHGVRVIGVADGGTPGFTCEYEIRRSKAIAAIFEAWRSKAGIERVRIVRASKYSAADEEMIEEAAEEAGLQWEHVEVRDDAIGEAIAALGKNRDEGVILPAAPAARLSLLNPPAFARLVTTCRVALPDGPVTTLFGSLPNSPVDLITVDWRAVAKKIVGDIAAKRAVKKTRPTVFEATPRLRALLSRYAENI